ncbi:MAG: hypothetical protein JXR62_06575 [Bacilli bacterium]|nr:hypothetical protein [Bacilli bacterium]
MKALLIASMIMGGGSAAALQNEEVAGAVEGVANQITYRVQNMFKGSNVENIKENGFSYPSDEYLATLTEEQAFAITSAIDVINATNDWSSMTDEEITVAIAEARASLQALYADLGIDGPATQVQARVGRDGEKGKGGFQGKGRDENFVPNGDGLQDGTCLDDEVVPEANDLV